MITVADLDMLLGLWAAWRLAQPSCTTAEGPLREQTGRFLPADSAGRR